MPCSRLWEGPPGQRAVGEGEALPALLLPHLHPSLATWACGGTWRPATVNQCHPLPVVVGVAGLLQSSHPILKQR